MVVSVALGSSQMRATETVGAIAGASKLVFLGRQGSLGLVS